MVEAKPNSPSGLAGVILMLAANPKGTVKLGLVDEYKHVLRRLTPRNCARQLLHFPEASADDLVDLLLDHRDVRILHFSGHGTPEGLEFEDASGYSELASPEAITSTLAEFKQVNCVVLNACYSASLAELIGQHVEWVVGMTSAVLDSVAIAFSGRFYAALAEGKGVDAAFRVALAGTRLSDEEQAEVPQLYWKGAPFDHVTPTEADARDVTRHNFGDDGPVLLDELERYREWIQRWHRLLPKLGFRSTPRRDVELQELVVTLNATADPHRPGGQIASGPDFDDRAAAKGDPHGADTVSLADAFVHAEAKGYQALVLLGDPGTGKTTFLKQALLKVLDEGPSALGLPDGTVPVFLPLRELRDARTKLADFIQEQQEQMDPSGRVPPNFGPRLVERGKLLLLFDGLDEIAEVDRREQVARWLEKIRVAMDDCYLLVSSRYAGYVHDVALDMKFLELNVRPLDDEQMRALVHSCYAQFEGEGESSARRADELVEKLSSPAFAGVARLYEMTRNPLLLTGVCLVHQAHGELPHARAELYEQCIQVLLEKWQSRREELALDTEEVRTVLEPVAWWMHDERGRRRATGAQLRGPLEQELEKLAQRGVAVPAADRFLRELREESGLVVGFGEDDYEFTHLGFQEFLAARAVVKQASREGTREVCESLVLRFGDSWWQEVILLLLAQSRVELFQPIMRALMRQPIFADMWGSELMQLCLREAHATSPTPFLEFLRTDERSWLQRLLGWLRYPFGWGAAEGVNWSRRQLGAAKLLAYAMHHELHDEDPRLRRHPAVAVRRWWAVVREQPETQLSERGGVELVRIPAGAFMMGSPKDDEQAYDNEHPQRRVELAEFYLAKTPVTNAQYGRYLEANSEAPKPEHWGDRKWNQPEQPVVGVSWEEAQAYCEWAGLVLPTEAQWEYACRAGTTTRYWAGDEEADLARVGWYVGNSGGRTHPVGEKEANAWGLHDVHGNVLEWCLDGWGGYETEPQPGDGLRHEPGGVALRVFRGGSWTYPAGLARSAYRDGWPPADRYGYVGFRPALRP